MITRSDFSWNAVGISAYNAPVAVASGSSATHNSVYGIYISISNYTGTPMSVMNSDITQNASYGLYIANGGGSPPYGHQNNIVDNNVPDMRQAYVFSSSTPADWTNNYWGLVLEDVPCPWAPAGQNPNHLSYETPNPYTSLPKKGPVNYNNYYQGAQKCGADKLKNSPYAKAPFNNTGLRDMPPLLLSATQNTPNEPEPLRETCLNPGAWPTGWSRMTAFGNAFEFWAAWTSDSEVSECFANLRAAGKELVIGAGVLKAHCTTAQACWNGEEPTFTRLAGLNPPPLTFVLDEPLTGSEDYADYAYAVDQTAEWIALARAQYPTAKIMVQEAYPHQVATELTPYFIDVNTEAISRTGWGIQSAIIDHDWNLGGTFLELWGMQENIQANGMAFGVIFWDASPSMDWYDGLMFQGEWYQGWRLSGLSPDLYEINNWTGLPSTTLGETSADYKSFTNSVRDFVQRFLPLASLPSNGLLFPDQSITSVDGRFSLTYQGDDGNLVLRNVATSEALWSSNTSGTSPGFTWMHGNGNLVVYDGSGNPQWSSNTPSSGAFLVVQGDGNLVIYSNYDNQALWASDTNEY
jgi:hypothetical protein